ncbi:DUF4954 family protein [Ichthyobacterium seriolicida]|uniref:DUF4954 domain-containing protein n=1 Tax=Ichthyobacterium seriolicida TaxID=242600 RepID=A0A1J1E9U7_9FLAO|nr:DUF4954 family protein [Ichthyobacterium seriolicida]BAV94691.1 hypothetical protein JBKA6_0678 [Ichthyobacterium seriolicida]
MSLVKKSYAVKLGYDFITEEYLPKGKDEYYIRDESIDIDHYRTLSKGEIESLIKNGNESNNWEDIFVSEGFNASMVKNCKFYGKIRIGILEDCHLEYSTLKVPVGLYDSMIISCDIGDNVSISNVQYLSHYKIANEVILSNLGNIHTSNHSKFGNGILKEGEQEHVRIWLEICNESKGRAVLPFDGMLSADAYIWSKYRDRDVLMSKLKGLTNNRYSDKRGHYGTIGNGVVIRNSHSIQDTKIGDHAYIKGVNKIKNTTINSSMIAPSQIGEGVEMVNGIVGYGCRVFYGVKAVRFIMDDHSTLKYGARLINSYLGGNSTISCCEVLNSLIFNGHEQHHNNSFLCASLVMGQSNIAAGVTIGSNHNSRANDGEIIANRGFWPALCVNLKHNSKFASFCLVSKGSYPHELRIDFPFSLVANDERENSLKIIPAYWFLYNFYALERNCKKMYQRDKRVQKRQNIEFDYLAPDTIDEIFSAIEKLEEYIDLAIERSGIVCCDSSDKSKIKKEYLESSKHENLYLEILAEDVENSTRKVHILKVKESYKIYKDLILLYSVKTICKYFYTQVEDFGDILEFIKSTNLTHQYDKWKNIGGQLMKESDVEDIISEIENGKLESWEAIHDKYSLLGEGYLKHKFEHAVISLLKLLEIQMSSDLNADIWNNSVKRAISVQEYLCDSVISSREKDYTNPYRKMVYDNTKEMNNTLGELNQNSVIISVKEETESIKQMFLNSMC